jgi:hypothetical protein
VTLNYELTPAVPPRTLVLAPAICENAAQSRDFESHSGSPTHAIPNPSRINPSGSQSLYLDLIRTVERVVPIQSDRSRPHLDKHARDTLGHPAVNYRQPISASTVTVPCFRLPATIPLARAKSGMQMQLCSCSCRLTTALQAQGRA